LPARQKELKMAELKFTFKRPCLEISGEMGSLAELIGYMQEESATLTTVFGDDMEAVVQRIGGETKADAPAAAEPPKTRGRPKKAAPEAVAPDPLPVPTQETAPPLVPATTVLPPNQLAPAPLDTTPNANGVPAFLDRTAPPPLPSAPPLPAAPSLPPVGTLGPKVVAALDERAKGSPDGGQALADWLAGHGLTLKGASYADACRAVLMMRDDKLAAAAAQLGVS
jgi:hypothetical protein